MFEDIFLRKRPNEKKLIDYGFSDVGSEYLYSTPVFDGDFILYIHVDRTGGVKTTLIETENREEYVLYKTDSQGAFVGDVRKAIEAVLSDIAEKCYDVNVFKAKQSSILIEYVHKTYGDTLEFLWEKSPNNAIWRRKDSQKWYAAILTVQKSKLGIPSDEVVEIMDLRGEPEGLEKLIDHQRYYPGWHMNKKHWFTIILDGSVSMDEICSRLNKSYLLAK